MTTQTKTVLALLLTLVLGMVIGVLGSGAVIRPGQQPPPGMREERFINRMHRVLDLDDSLMELVDPILSSHATRMTGMNKRHRTEMDTEMDSLQAELSTILTPEQMEPLRQMRHFGGHGRSSGGPGPPGGRFGGGKRGKP